MPWKPATRPGVDLKALPLSPLQGYVVSRLDGASDVDALSKATGLPAERVSSLLHELVALGAVTPDAEPAPPPAVAPARPAAIPAATVIDSPRARAKPPVSEAMPDGPPLGLEDEPPTDVHHMPNDPNPIGELLSTIPSMHTPAQLDDVAGGEGDDAPPYEPADETEEPELPEAITATHRDLFETRLHALSVDDRSELAHLAREPELSALCFDPVPAVIHALLDNPNLGLTQARLIAKHHRNPVGLEALAARAAFAADGGVRRGLLHNPLLPTGLYRRLWGMRRLLDQYNVTVSHEVPDQTKRTAREVMRNRFATGPAEERVELIIKTEGRCLPALTALPLDSKTTALMCGRTYGSTFLVQNLARWSAAPPQLIAHLLRQELVKRNAMLRNLLERHPNAPSGAP